MKLMILIIISTITRYASAEVLIDPPKIISNNYRPTYNCVISKRIIKKKAIIYTKYNCPYCDILKNKWESNKRVFFLNVETSKNIMRSANSLGITKFPTLVLPNGTKKVGYIKAHQALKKYFGNTP